MANIITSSEVFEFMGSPDDVQTNQATMITNLITREQKELETTLGRKVSTENFTNILFQHELNCRIYDHKLFLSGIYRDTYTISAITENGVILVASTDYNDGGDYYLDIVKGILIKIGGFWSLGQLSIKISGSLGLGGASALDDVKQILIEVVAARSGLWKNNVETEDGTIATIRTKIPNGIKNMIKKYTLRDF